MKRKNKEDKNPWLPREQKIFLIVMAIIGGLAVVGAIIALIVGLQ